jgi:hypothetical protein
MRGNIPKRKVDPEEEAEEDRLKLLQNKLPRKGPQIHKHIIYRDSNYIPFSETRIIESPIFSSLWLQKFLYFNFYFAIFFFFTLLTVYIYKLWAFELNIWHILRVILLLPWVGFEIARLNEGYYGNIKETFPDLISFVLLTIINTGVVVALIILPTTFPIEISIIIVALVFNVCELIIGAYAMSTLVRSQTALFFLRSPAQNARQDKMVRDEKRIEEETLLREQQMNQDGNYGDGDQYVRRRVLDNNMPSPDQRNLGGLGGIGGEEPRRQGYDYRLLPPGENN